MNIRNRITLWITGAGLLAGLLFSIVISYELIEQPYELLDAELDSQAHTLLVGLAPGTGNPAAGSNKTMLESLGRLYWFKVFDQQQELVYASAMTNFADLPLKKRKNSYNISATIPKNAGALEQDDSNEVTFRVRIFTIPFGEQEYLVQIARPMEKLQEEIVDLVIAIAVGLIVFTLALVLLGYLVAGKILQPITEINALALEISDKTLDKRIPLPVTHDELYRLSSSLNRMFDRLQFSFNRQKEFIADASHELKTPLAMQRLFFDEAGQRNDLPPDFQNRLDAQEKICHRMDRLVKNLLDLSALDLTDSLDPAKVNLSVLADSLLLDFDDIFRAASIQLTVDIQENVTLLADEEKLRRVLINLIDNAIKYNAEHNPEIRFSLRTKDSSILMEISNSGRGIPPDELSLVFNQFYRVEKSRATAHGGSGLGLTIVQRIIELHHGSIEIENAPHNMVRVRITLPADG
ncbi:MAG: HAMP domain-containing histidine kinase [Desulfobulbaceae bacterium]|nr:HAMP domain-containing histidine kinase [Desulfobulbaceae bacterium]